MRALVFIMVFAFSSVIFASETSKKYTPVGSLKTKEYLVELGIKGSNQVYVVRTHSGEKLSEVMSEKEFLANYPALYDSVINSMADDASIFPKRF